MDGYVREKLGAGVSCLIGLGDIKTRLEHALISMITIDASNFSDPALGARYGALYTRATSVNAQIQGEGSIRATLRSLTEEEVGDLAEELLSIHNEMLRAA